MTWRFLDSGLAPGPCHMAIDDALLQAVARGHSPPLLRVFAFHPTCLSLGRFQAARRDPRIAGIDIVRRPTGGGAVLHAGDLCYAVVAPGDDPAVGGTLRDSYCRIALALAHALLLLGASTYVGATFVGATFRSPSAANRGGSCFAALGPFEVALRGVKVVGSAQLRRDGAFLQQGSLRLATDPELEARLLGASPPALGQLIGRPIPYQEAAAALRRAFTQALGITFQPSALTDEEQALAQTLEQEKYASPAWTWQR